MDKDIQIKKDSDGNFNTNVNFLKREDDFIRNYENLSKSQNSDYFIVFIDNKRLLNNKQNSKFILIKNEVKFPDIYEEIGNYLIKNLDAYNEIIGQKIDKKTKEYMKLKNVYHSENILTLNILEEKLSIYYKNFQDGIKNIIEILRKEFTDIINYETYLKELIECKKIFVRSDACTHP